MKRSYFDTISNFNLLRFPTILETAGWIVKAYDSVQAETVRQAFLPYFDGTPAEEYVDSLVYSAYKSSNRALEIHACGLELYFRDRFTRGFPLPELKGDNQFGGPLWEIYQRHLSK